MDYELVIIVPKDGLKKIGLNEMIHEWGDNSFSCDPPRYITEDGMIFEQEDIEYYIRVLNIEADDSFVALYFKTGADMLYQLEWDVNHQRIEQDRNCLLDLVVYKHAHNQIKHRKYMCA